MQRKLIKQGRAGLTMYLPKQWLDANELKPGDEVSIKEDENGLLVSPAKRKTDDQNTIIIDLQNWGERSIRNTLHQLYRKGYDTVHLLYHVPDQLTYARQVIQDSLIGFEITTETPTQFRIQNIAEPADDKFETLFRKVFQILSDEAKTITQEVAEGTWNKLLQHTQQRNILDKYSSFLRRSIINNKVGGSRNSYLLYFLLAELSFLCHAYHRLYQGCVYRKRKANKNAIIMLEQVTKLTAQLEPAYYAKDISLGEQIGNPKRVLFDKIYALLNKTDKNDELYHVAEILRLTQRIASVYVGLFVDAKKKETHS